MIKDVNNIGFDSNVDNSFNENSSSKVKEIGSSIKKVLGMGEYEKQKSSIKMTAFKIVKLIAHLTITSAYLGVTIFLGIVCPLSLIGTIPVGLAVCGFEAYNINKLATEISFQIYHKIKNRNHLAPSTSKLGYDKYLKNCPKNYEWDNKIAGVVALEDPPHTFKLKKEMIENAEQEILISGSYCGRAAFDKILDAIEKRMEQRPNLRVSILSSKRFITNSKQYKSANWDKIKNLTKKYPDRFFMTITYESSQNNPYDNHFKYISNHTKLMIVDRKVMVTGGSGIEDRWMNQNGLEDMLSLQEKKGLNAKPSQKKVPKESFVNASIARAFRDKDFLFYSNSNESIIESSVFEFYKLMTRWHHFESTVMKNDIKVREIAAQRGKKHKLNNFHDFYKPIEVKKARINVNNLDLKRDEICKPKQCKFFATGPELKHNHMEDEIVNLFKNAKKNIVLNHMYFHPTKAIFDALANALKRNVKITVITNQYNKKSPRSHKAFAPRTLSLLHKLNKVQRINQDNLKVYCWDKELVTNHQKVIVVDDNYALCGSSNFSYKGLNSMSDYEHNVLVESPELCQNLQKSFELDVKACKRISKKELSKRPSLHDLFFTWVHQMSEKKIG